MKEKMEVDESGSESEEEKPTGVKRRSQRKEGEESDVGSVCISAVLSYFNPELAVLL